MLPIFLTLFVASHGGGTDEYGCHHQDGVRHCHGSTGSGSSSGGSNASNVQPNPGAAVVVGALAAAAAGVAALAVGGAIGAFVMAWHAKRGQGMAVLAALTFLAAAAITLLGAAGLAVMSVGAALGVPAVSALGLVVSLLLLFTIPALATALSAFGYSIVLWMQSPRETSPATPAATPESRESDVFMQPREPRKSRSLGRDDIILMAEGILRDGGYTIAEKGAEEIVTDWLEQAHGGTLARHRIRISVRADGPHVSVDCETQRTDGNWYECDDRAIRAAANSHGIEAGKRLRGLISTFRKGAAEPYSR